MTWVHDIRSCKLIVQQVLSYKRISLLLLYFTPHSHRRGNRDETLADTASQHKVQHTGHGWLLLAEAGVRTED